MKKEIRISIFAMIVVLAVLFMVYYLNFSPTGFAVLSQYTSESSCVSNGYAWENLTEQNCTTITNCVNETINCEPCLEYEDLNGTQGDCITWSSCPEENCTDTQECVNIIVGGQCVGDICDSSHLSLCLSETTCTGASGHWYNSICNVAEQPSCSNDLDLCSDENSCVNIGSGYWYDDSCNAEEEETTEETNATEAVSEEQIPVTTTEEEPEITAISIGEISVQNLNQGDSKSLTLSVQNTGTTSVSSCALTGDDSGFVSITGSEAMGINAGESAVYSFSLNIPKNANLGAHTVTLSVTCSETGANKEVSVNVLQKKLDFNITNVQRTREDRVRVAYAITELVGENQDVQIFFSIKDAFGLQVANISQNKSIGANKTDDFRVNMPINETLKGNLTLSAAFNSQIYSSNVLEPISLGAPIGGFAIFEGLGGTGSIILLVAVVLIIVAIFFIARKMRKSAKR